MSLWDKNLASWQRNIKSGDMAKSQDNENYLVTDVLTSGAEIWLSVQCARGVIVKPCVSLLPLDDNDVLLFAEREECDPA